MMRSGNIFEREGSRGHGCDGDGTEITGGGELHGFWYSDSMDSD